MKIYKHVWNIIRNNGLFGEIADSPQQPKVNVNSQEFLDSILNCFANADEFWEWIDRIKIERSNRVEVPDFKPAMAKVDAIVKEMRNPNTSGEPSRAVLPEEINREAIKDILSTVTTEDIPSSILMATNGNVPNFSKMLTEIDKSIQANRTPHSYVSSNGALIEPVKGDIADTFEEVLKAYVDPSVNKVNEDVLAPQKEHMQIPEIFAKYEITEEEVYTIKE